jgi:hypothetical protein
MRPTQIVPEPYRKTKCVKKPLAIKRNKKQKEIEIKQKQIHRKDIHTAFAVIACIINAHEIL